MIPFRPEQCVHNNVEYLPAYDPRFSVNYYGITGDCDEESEKSYETTFLVDGYIATFVFLSFHTTWCVIAATTVTLLFTFISYREVFDNDFIRNPLVAFLYCILNFLNLMDIISSMLHFASREWRQLGVYKRKKWALILIDILSVLATIVDLVLYIVQPADRTYTRIMVCIIMLRLYRMFEHFIVISRNPLGQGLLHVLIKYTLLTFIVTHSSACVWMMLACFNCKDGKGHWNDIFTDNITPFNMYLLCVFNSLDSVSTMGMVGGSRRNTEEFVLTTVLMMYCMIINSGTFLGTFTELLVMKNRRRSQFQMKQRLIEKRLDDILIPDGIQKTVNNWYVNFWVQENGIIEYPMLAGIPNSFQRDLDFDKYFIALNTSHHLRILHDELKIALSLEMKTTQYNEGDIILKQGEAQSSIIYVAKGIAQLVSLDDIESPIIMFKYGTSIGSASMLFASPIKENLIATTYCQVYTLARTDLWRTISRYYKLRASKPIFETNEFLMQNAYKKDSARRKQRHRGRRADKTLKVVKQYLTKRTKSELTGNLTEDNLLGVYQINTGVGVTKVMDHTFVFYTCPWILYKTHLWVMWQCIIFAISVVVIAVYPYCLIYLPYPPLVYSQLLRPFVYGVFMIDIVIQLFTSTVDSHQQLISNYQEILAYRIGKIMFLLDLLSITPFELLFVFMDYKWHENRGYIQCNHMLKVIRVFKELVALTFKFRGKTFKIGFYVICLMYFGYLQGLIYFKTACPSIPCDSSSWVAKYIAATEAMNMRGGNETIYILLVAVHDGVMLLTGAAGIVTPLAILGRFILSIFCVSYLFLFTYLLADYCATLTLDRSLQDQFQRDVYNLRKFMKAAKMNRNIMERVDIYMETIYSLSDGQVKSNLMEDIPSRYLDSMEVYRALPFVKDIPVLEIFSQQYLYRLLSRVKYGTYPPNEYIAYAGDRNFNMYVIVRGHCEIRRGGMTVKSEIGPGDNTGVMEMMLRQPLAHDMLTLTSVLLFSLNIQDFREVLYMQEGRINALDEITQSIREWRAFKIKIDLHLERESSTKHEEVSIVNFNGSKVDPQTLEFQRGWGRYAPMRFLLLRMTFMPDSKFIYIYVIFHAVVAFMSSVLYPAMFIIECLVPWYVVILLTIPIDVLCLIDVYLRMHVCIYTSSGVLISHPRWTALYYLRHSFPVDFVTALPLKLIFDPFVSKKASAYIMFVKVIRAYRVPNGFAYFHRDILTCPPTYQLILRYLTISLIYWHCLTLGLILISTELGTTKDDYPSIRLLNASFFYSKTNSEISFQIGVDPGPMELYLLALYALISFSLQIAFVDVFMVRTVELLYIICTLISGYIWFTYVLVIISNTETVYDDNLTQYKNNLKDLCRFMKAQHIPNHIQARNIRHFEYIYQRNQGYRNEGLFNEHDPTLRKDSQWAMYAPTLLSVNIFKHLDLTFYQQLCSEIRIVYYLENNNILCVNDVINWVYIISRGMVEVRDTTGAALDVITRGSMFGNLDNVMYSRNLLEYSTLTSVDIFCLPTDRLYAILLENNTVRNSLKASLIRHNFNYLKSTDEAPPDDLIPKLKTFTYTSVFIRLLMSSGIKFFYLFIAYFSFQETFYHICFQKHLTFIYWIAYILDTLHLLKICYMFSTPYIDEVGVIITSRVMIRRRVLRKRIFYIDLFALLPFEIFAFACPIGYVSIHKYIAIFRSNRLLRIFTIPIQIKDALDSLHLNAVIVKIVSLFIYSTVFFHMLACGWFLAACPEGICRPGTWVYDEKTDELNCVDYTYICSLYFITSLVSLTGFGTFVPRKIHEIVFCIITIVASKFVMTILIGNMAALVRHFGFRLQAYTENLNMLITYFKNADISPKLRRNLLKYAKRIWLYNSGLQMPLFMETGPTVLIEELKMFAFGTHIFSNPVFDQCHNDFLRILTAHTKLVHYFRGDVICNQNEINDTMYFIHWGQVEVLCITPRVEVQVDLLTQLDCFGMIQGLFPSTPHSHTFRACATTEIVTLCFGDWMQNLAFYPSARFHIYRTMRDYHSLLKYIRNPSSQICSDSPNLAPRKFRHVQRTHCLRP